MKTKTRRLRDPGCSSAATVATPDPDPETRAHVEADLEATARSWRGWFDLTLTANFCVRCGASSLDFEMRCGVLTGGQVRQDSGHECTPSRMHADMVDSHSSATEQRTKPIDVGRAVLVWSMPVSIPPLTQPAASGSDRPPAPRCFPPHSLATVSFRNSEHLRRI